MTSVSTAVSLLSSVTGTSSTTSSTTSTGLVKLANGEYTSASVTNDPTDASKLGLVKEKDGNYGTTAPSQVSPPSTKSTSLSSGFQAALTTLTLGGS